MKIHPTTRQRYVTARHTGDIVIDAKGPSDSQNVDIVPVLAENSRQGIKQLLFNPTPDKQWGTDAWLEGARTPELDNLGNRKQTTRQRVKRIYINSDGEDKSNR